MSGARPTALPPRGLYAVTDAGACAGRGLAACVAAAVAGGAAVVQYRDKGQDAGRRREEVRALLGICRPAGVPLIVNDDVGLALECGADGVHLGRDDPPPAEARAALGARAIIGVSCYDDLERALGAAAGGADYVAFGSFYPSPTKPGAVRADPGLLRAARARIAIPVVAIGGITAENGAPLLEAGADFLAAIQGVFGAADVRAAAARYAALFEPGARR